jgi:hypothetical protein
MRRVFLAVAVLLTVSGQNVWANLILNGSFETNTAGSTMFNMSNATFNATVSNATAFGSAQEIDLITGAPFGSLPQSGNWKLAIHTVSPGGSFDAFTFNLSAPIVAGNTYKLEFYAQSVLDFDPDIAAVQVGLATNATSFGTQIFSGVPGTVGWTHFVHTFVAPTNATHLSVRPDPNAEVWNHIDNFSLVEEVAIPEPTSCVLLGIVATSLMVGAAFRRPRQQGA